MIFKRSSILFAVSVANLGITLGQSVNGASYNKPSAGPPASFFAANPTIPVTALRAAAAKASVIPKGATFPVNFDSDSPKATIHSDWVNFANVCTFYLYMCTAY